MIAFIITHQYLAGAKDAAPPDPRTPIPPPHTHTTAPRHRPRTHRTPHTPTQITCSRPWLPDARTALAFGQRTPTPFSFDLHTHAEPLHPPAPLPQSKRHSTPRSTHILAPSPRRSLPSLPGPGRPLLLAESAALGGAAVTRHEESTPPLAGCCSSGSEAAGSHGSCGRLNLLRGRGLGCRRDGWMKGCFDCVVCGLVCVPVCLCVGACG